MTTPTISEPIGVVPMAPIVTRLAIRPNMCGSASRWQASSTDDW
jgi:hypothetical protein